MGVLLYFPRWSDVLLEIYKSPAHRRYCQRLNRRVKASMNHLRSIVRILEQDKLVEIVPTRKIKKIFLTQKGRRIAILFLKIRQELK